MVYGCSERGSECRSVIVDSIVNGPKVSDIETAGLGHCTCAYPVTAYPPWPLTRQNQR